MPCCTPGSHSLYRQVWNPIGNKLVGEIQRTLKLGERVHSIDTADRLEDYERMLLPRSHDLRTHVKEAVSKSVQYRFESVGEERPPRGHQPARLAERYVDMDRGDLQ